MTDYPTYIRVIALVTSLKTIVGMVWFFSMGIRWISRGIPGNRKF